MSAADTLKNLSIRSDWTLEERLMMAARMEEVVLPAGRALLAEGQPAAAAYILKQGRLRILSRGEILGVVDVVSCFGEISCLLPDTPVTATVMTESESTLYRIGKDDLLATVQRVPKLWRALFMQMSDRLKRANKRLAEVLEHSPQGFLKLDRNACVTNEYSRKCVDYLGENPLAGYCLPELLTPDASADVASWKSVFGMVFDDVGVPLSDLFDLLSPEARLQANGVMRDLRLQFHPIYEAGQVVAVDVGIEDITRERELERAREVERGRQATLGKIYQNPDSFFGLLRLIDDVEAAGAVLRPALRAAGPAGRQNDIARLQRDLHSLKGFAGNFGLLALRRSAHELESALGALADAPADPGGDALDRLEAAFDRLDVACTEGRTLRSLIDPSLLQRLEGVVLVPDRLAAMRAALAAGDVATASAILQAAEAVEVRQLFACWPVDIERFCVELGKDARLEVYGVGGMVPKPIFNALDRVLVHALSNAMAHGVEDPETRLCADKDPQGVISVIVEVSPDRLSLEIADDGAGIDVAAAIARAREAPGIDAELLERCIASEEPWRVLLLRGFSTSSEPTDVSGRGVGLDALAAVVADLGGEVAIDSTPGQGFALRLSIPLAASATGQG